MHVVAESVSPTELARRIDHSLLRPEATAADIARLCDQAVQWRFYAVCVNPIFVSLAARHLQRQPVRICSVAGFPLGAEPLATKIDQARRAIDDGADEIDMVVHLAALISGDADALRREISAVAELVHSASPQHVLKVILETAALDRQQMRLGCRCARQAGADFVKTSSGFHPAGGATVEAVRQLRRFARPVKVKAAGGIRDLATALAMLRAGADRLGTSASVAILQELTGARPG